MEWGYLEWNEDGRMEWKLLIMNENIMSKAGNDILYRISNSCNEFKEMKWQWRNFELVMAIVWLFLLALCSPCLTVNRSILPSCSGWDISKGAFGGECSSTQCLLDFSLLPDHAGLLLPQGWGLAWFTGARPLPLVWFCWIWRYCLQWHQHCYIS